MKNICYLIVLLMFFACTQEAKTNEKEEITTEKSTNTGLTTFELFYQQFHADSTFQKEHVLFPLQGIPSNADSAALQDRGFRWQAEEWVTQHELTPDSEFKSTILPVDSALVIERIMHQSGDYAMERRFAKLNGEWMLIYYAGVNRVLK